MSKSGISSLASSLILQSGIGSANLFGDNNVDTVSYSIPYSQISSIAHSKDGSWAVNYNYTPTSSSSTSGSKEGGSSTSGSKEGDNTSGSKAGSTAATDTLQGIERLSFSDGVYVALDIATPNQVAGAALALLYAGFNSLPDAVTFGHWIAKADQINDNLTFDSSKVESLAQVMLTEFAPGGISNSDLVNTLYTNVVGHTPGFAVLNQFTQSINNGTYSQAGLFALAAESSLNTDHYATLVGNGLQYVPESGKLG
ncbi:MAG: hypothetical protein AAB073_06200 [Pseudomonadota bacterium]